MKKLIFLLAIAAMLAPPLRGQEESDTVWTRILGPSLRIVEFSPDGESILAGGGDDHLTFLYLLDTETGKTKKGYKYKGEKGSFFQGIFSITGDTVISAYRYDSDHKKILFYNTQTGELIENLTIDFQYLKIWDMELSGDGKFLYVFGSNCLYEERLLVIDIVSSEIISEINSYNKVPFMKADLSDDGNYIAAVRGIYPVPPRKEWQYYLELRDQKTLESIKNFGSVNVINDLCFSPDGTMIASAGDDGKLKVWNVESGELIHEFESSPFLSCAFSIDSKFLVAGGMDNMFSIWDINNEEKVYQSNKIAFVREVDISPNNNFIAVGLSDEVILFHARWEPNSIPEEMGSTEFNVFPNPVKRILNVHFVIDEPVMTGLEILDISGSVLFKEEYGLLLPGEYDKIINTAGLPVGTYFCRLHLGKASHSVKFIISE